MNELVWIRPLDYDPAVEAGSQVRPGDDFPYFEVLDRKPVVMLFKDGTAWDIKPFTQLTLKMVADDQFGSAEP